MRSTTAPAPAAPTVHPIKRASGGPADAGGIEIETKRQIVDGAADDDVVVAKQQAAESGNGGRDDKRTLMRIIVRAGSSLRR